MASEDPAVMLCEAAPPSLHERKTYCVPAASWDLAPCVAATAMVWGPGARVSVLGAVCTAPPSTVNCRPVGLVWMVIAGFAALSE